MKNEKKQQELQKQKNTNEQTHRKRDETKLLVGGKKQRQKK